jgi:SAM-dependent methyltransferase
MQHYPIPHRELSRYERLVLRLGVCPGRCTVCGALTQFRAWKETLRDTGSCVRCKARNRQRQIALLIRQVFAGNARFRSLQDTDLAIYNLEANGSLHEALARNANYVASEYLGPDRKPGEVVDGIRHEDAQRLSFPDRRFDLVISSDVWEHLPDPYAAHREIHRVLRPNGRHIFTVPFYQAHFLDETRARLDAEGNLEHLLEPIYHLDPMNPKGVLVFNIFSIEMLCKLSRMGYYTRMYKLYRPLYGILGNNGLVFDAVKIK